MTGDRVMYKGGPIRLVAKVRGCEPKVMKTFGWPWPWPFEVLVGKKVIAVCRDHETANGAVLDFLRSEQGGT